MDEREKLTVQDEAEQLRVEVKGLNAQVCSFAHLWQAAENNVEFLRSRIEQLESALKSLLDWHEYESDPEVYRRLHAGWVPLLPWRRAYAALKKTEEK